MSDKRTICLDFDGVLHSYESGWQGIDVIPDEPVPGAFEALAKYVEVFDVCIYSSRSSSSLGVEAMKAWMHRHGLPLEVFEQLGWPTQKPPALYGLDDRVERFEGRFPSVETILAFKPWNKRSEPSLDGDAYPILRFFAYAHLPAHLQAVSRPFCELAQQLAAELPQGAETSVALRKLLESKDAAVRAAVSPTSTKAQ